MIQPYDMPLEELEKYRPEFTRQPDFDDFWDETLAELSKVPVKYELHPYNYPVKGIKLYEISFPGFNFSNIGGYYAVPDLPGPHPGVVLFHGYNWAPDGNIHDVVNWSLHGYAVLHMHVRGQYGKSIDNIIPPDGFAKGWMTKGIQSPLEYYYRSVYMDSLRAVEILAAMREVDSKRIGLVGKSQGGALTLSTAAFSSIPVIAIADYPFLSNFDRAIDIAPQGPYNELNEYFRRNQKQEIEKQAKITLSYFDIMNLAPRIKCDTFVTVGLVDEITPPSTVFAAYNHMKCSRRIITARYFGHEFISFAFEQELKCLMEHL